MRILCLDCDIQYLNPTRNLIVRLLSLCGKVSCFGPGYVSSEVLALGLKEFIKLYGPFDVVIATEHIIFASDYIGPDIKKIYLKNYFFQFPKKDLDERKKILTEFKELPLKKVACLLESDYYNFSQSKLDSLEKSADFFIGWGSQFFQERKNLPQLNKEVFSENCNDNWLNFVIKNEQKIIPLAQFIDDHEFCFTDIAHRPFDWSVPGAAYHARNEAKTYLKSAKGLSLNKSRHSLFGATLSRFGLNPFSWPFYIAYSNFKFRNTIMRSKFVFTCGSGLNWPVRKFFEIPALGSVLVCKPCNGFLELGFKDGVNAIISAPKDLPALHQKLAGDLNETQKIASLGRALVSEKHSINVRAVQLKNALEKVINCCWYGGRWHDGVMVPLSQNSIDCLD